MTLVLALPLTLAASDIPDYKTGDVAKEDIVTPGQLVVVDSEETAALKQKEGSRVPVICRYYTNLATDAEAAFSSAFDGARSNFLDKLEASFKRRTIDSQTLASDRFQRFVASYDRQNKAFPVTTNLAELWAQGESDRVTRASLLAALHEALSHPIRPSSMPPELKFGYTVRLVPLADTNEVPTLETAEQDGLNTSRTNILTVSRARELILENLAADDKSLAKFLGSLLRTNCVPDPDLTQQARAKRTDPLWAADRYQAGQVVVKRGQVIDHKLKAALDQLRDKTAAADLAQRLSEEQNLARQNQVWKFWTAAAVAGFLTLLIILLWFKAQRRRSVSWLPAITTKTATSFPLASASSSASPELPARLAPHLARFLMDKFVRKLLSQRTDLLDDQENAAAEMAELEARLEKIHAPLQERLRAYEQRIGELEKELAQKGEENRELIKFKIALVQNQLAATKGRLELN